MLEGDHEGKEDQKMFKEDCGQIRTKQYDIRICDLKIIDGLPTLMIKRNGLRDIYTLQELLARIYGENCHCLIFNENGTQLEF
jgi:hypothetical protein